jgi:uncharacterized damage-inducible protein DinB
MLDPRYPIGPFESEPATDDAARRACLIQLAEAPSKLRAATAGLSEGQLDTPYRSGGWTVRQVVHHLADSHLNWYIRTRIALTEDEPTIRPYDQERWAELADARVGPIEPSLALYAGLHARWVRLFESLAPEDWSRRFFHPERGWLTLAGTLPMMAWHSRHHVAQVAALRQKMRW